MSGIHGQVLGHIVRRGVEAMRPDEPVQSLGDMGLEAHPGFVYPYQQPAWAWALYGFTAVVFYLLFISVSYTVGHVIATLAMIESPTSTMTVDTKEACSDPSVEKQPLVDVEQTVTLVPTTPITSQIRRAIRHLHTTAGFTARWRGLYPAIVYNVVGSLTFVVGKQVLDNAFPSLASVSEYFVGALVAALWARLHCAWTHATIAMPSGKRLSQRVPPAAAWRHLALPAVNAELAALSSCNLVRILTKEVNRFGVEFRGDATWVVLAGLAIPVTAVLLAVFVVVPNTVILTRIEAFLLPKDEDTIVPFDRDLRASVDGATLRARDAWKGFSWQSFRIVCKTYVKLFFITIGLAVVAVHVLLLEAVLIVGPALETLVTAGQEQLRRRGLW